MFVLKKTSLPLQKAKAYVALSDELYIQNIDTVIPLCESAIKIIDSLTKNNQQTIDGTKIKAAALNNIGFVFNNYGSQSKALSYYLQSLKIREQINDQKGKVESYNNVASIYNSQGDTSMALIYYKKGLKISQSINDAKGMSNILNNIAVIYQKNPTNIKLALHYFFKSLEAEKSLNNLTKIGNREDNIAVVYHNMGNYENAKEHYLKSIIAKEQSEDQKGLMKTYNSLANLEFEKNNIIDAEKLAKKSLELATELELASGIIQASQTLHEIYSTQQKWKDALQMHELYSEYKDIQIEESNSSETTQLQMQFEFDKKLTEDSLKIAAENKIVTERFRVEKTQRYALFGGIILVGIFALFIFNRFKLTQKQKYIIEAKEKETHQQKLLVEDQKNLIEEKHKEITDSINYAERIQRTFLATDELLNQYLHNYFILFKPKDIVSGDFYWADNLPNGNFILATADSTGHGVPGAIMSLLNITSLEKAVENLNNPADILNHTRQTIIKRLKRDGSSEGGKDGMDCSLLVFDFKSKQLHIAAANNPVWIVRENNVIEVKPDKMPVGKHDRDQESFTLHVIDIKDGDLIYTLTDGFPDQFGGEKGKKFMSKNLKELLTANSKLPMNEQKELLDKTFINWIGDIEQVDDVTLIGIKI
jgi:serine phosphatase RsbU (regulator of sigma subunit)/tetratricopeptide (TPR) repeat protein